MRDTNLGSEIIQGKGGGERIRIDTHNHIYTKRYLQAVSKYGPQAGWSIKQDSMTGKEMLYGERGYPFVLTQSCYDMEERLKELNNARISMQVMSPSEPFFDFLEIADSKKLAMQVNDEIATITDKYPTRFAGLAGLPLNDIGASVEETRRAVKDLGLKGVILPTKVNGGRSIASPEFDELFEEFDRLSLAVFIHPTLPAGAEKYREFFLGMMILYPHETSITVAELLFNGALEKYKRMKIMVADLGGALPLMVGRMFRFYSAIDECRKNLRKEPLEYIKNIFFENGSEFYEHSMNCCYDMAGAGQIVLGTNHPSPIVAFKEAVGSIERMDVPNSEKEMMLYSNAKKLFSLDTI